MESGIYSFYNSSNNNKNSLNMTKKKIQKNIYYQSPEYSQNFDKYPLNNKKEKKFGFNFTNIEKENLGEFRNNENINNYTSNKTEFNYSDKKYNIDKNLDDFNNKNLDTQNNAKIKQLNNFFLFDIKPFINNTYNELLTNNSIYKTDNNETIKNLNSSSLKNANKHESKIPQYINQINNFYNKLNKKENSKNNIPESKYTNSFNNSPFFSSTEGEHNYKIEKKKKPNGKKEPLLINNNNNLRYKKASDKKKVKNLKHPIFAIQPTEVNSNIMKTEEKNNNLKNPILLKKIISKYLILNIFNYIEDCNNFKMKLFFHSHHFQNKINLSLFDYQKKYFDKMGKKIDEYLSGYNDQCEKYPKKFNRESLKQALKRDGDKFSDNSIRSYVVNYINYCKKIKNDLNIYIDIYSPFFNIFAKEEKFWEIFTIPINTEFINNNNLKDDYIFFFDMLNKSNINYSLLFNYKMSLDIKYLEEFQINFNSVKKLTIRPISETSGDLKTFIAQEDYSKFNNFLKTLFSLIDIESSLVYLTIEILSNPNKAINVNSILNLNNFKSLQYLELINFKLEKPFTLKLPSLKKLVLLKITNICLSEIQDLNDLIIYDSLLVNELTISNPSNLGKTKTILEKTPCFLDFKNLKYYEGDGVYLLNLKSEILEKVKLYRIKTKIFKNY